MKLSAALVAVSLVLAVFAGLRYRASLQVALPDEAELCLIDQLPASFAGQYQAQLSFSLSDLPQWHADPALVAAAHGTTGERAICGGDTPPETAARRLAKIDLWREYVAGCVTSLPEDFFSEPPYLHPSGHSYVGLALTTRPETFGKARWLAAHRAYLHVAEFDDAAARGLSLEPAERLASALSVDELAALQNNPKLLLARQAETLLIAQGDPAETPADYAVFSVQQWRNYLSDTAFMTEPYEEPAACLNVVGNVCWKANTSRVQSLVRQATWLGAGSVGLLGLTVLLAALRRARAQRREQQARLLVLQTLTHEIRTPATTLQLSLEAMRREFDELPEKAQLAFLRSCDAAQRLQKVIAASTQYLRGQRSGRLVQFREVAIPSVEQFVGSVVDSCEGDVRCRLEGRDQAVMLDPYWVGTCLRNLIDNALQHGREPVHVTVAGNSEKLRITVQDAGSATAFSFEEMTTPFVRGPASDGLGLGLAVVAQLVRSMGGSLQYEPDPTRFSIVLTNVRAPS